MIAPKQLIRTSFFVAVLWVAAQALCLGQNNVGDSGCGVVDIVTLSIRELVVQPGDVFWLTASGELGEQGVTVDLGDHHRTVEVSARGTTAVSYDKPGKYRMTIADTSTDDLAPILVEVIGDPSPPKPKDKNSAPMVLAAGPTVSVGSVFAGDYNGVGKYPVRMVASAPCQFTMFQYRGSWSQTWTFPDTNTLTIVDVISGPTTNQSAWTLKKVVNTTTNGTHVLSPLSPYQLQVTNLFLISGPAYAPLGQSVANTNVFLCAGDAVTLRAAPNPWWVTNNPTATGPLFEWTTNIVAAGTGLTRALTPAVGSNEVKVACHSPNTTPTNQTTTITVLNLAITPTNALACASCTNDCTNIVFSVTNGNTTVTWQLSPTAVSSGTPATIVASNDSSITVAPGTAFTNYVVTATSTDLTNLTATATLQALRVEIEQTNVFACASCTNNCTNITFSVTNSTDRLNWTLTPSNLVNGATITGTGATATVWPGSLQTNYIITATSTDLSNCVSTATLQALHVDILETNVWVMGNTNVVIHLTNSTSRVNWSLTPSNLVDGASLTVNGATVTVVTGTLLTNYTIAAVAQDLTNCVDTAMLSNMSVTLSNVSFTGHYAVRRDDDSGDYQAPHWTAMQSGPVAYTRNTTGSVIAAFLVRNYDGNMLIRGTGTGGLDVNVCTGTVASGVVITPDVKFTQAFPNQVDRVAAHVIEWQASIDGGASWRAVGNSTNEVFITLAAPACATRFRTVMYLACKNSGGTDAASCLANTWATFSGPANAMAWDGTNSYSRPLYYYFTPSTTVTNASDLLTAGEGQCYAWAELLRESLLVNHVFSKCVRVTADGELFGIQHIGVFEPPTNAFGAYGYNSMQLIQSVPGIPGQNMATPSRKVFDKHFIVCPTNVLTVLHYDPSYGVSFTGPEQFTLNAIGMWNHNFGNGYGWAWPTNDPTRSVQFTDFPWQ
jgi:hypothetical protein